MKIGPTLFFLWIASAAAIASAAEEGPNRPEPKPVMLDSKSTAVLVPVSYTHLTLPTILRV